MVGQGAQAVGIVQASRVGRQSNAGLVAAVGALQRNAALHRVVEVVHGQVDGGGLAQQPTGVFDGVAEAGCAAVIGRRRETDGAVVVEHHGAVGGAAHRRDAARVAFRVGVIGDQVGNGEDFDRVFGGRGSDRRPAAHWCFVDIGHRDGEVLRDRATVGAGGFDGDGMAVGGFVVETLALGQLDLAIDELKQAIGVIKQAEGDRGVGIHVGARQSQAADNGAGRGVFCNGDVAAVAVREDRRFVHVGDVDSEGLRGGQRCTCIGHNRDAVVLACFVVQRGVGVEDQLIPVDAEKFFVIAVQRQYIASEVFVFVGICEFDGSDDHIGGGVFKNVLLVVEGDGRGRFVDVVDGDDEGHGGDQLSIFGDDADVVAGLGFEVCGCAREEQLIALDVKTACICPGEAERVGIAARIGIIDANGANQDATANRHVFCEAGGAECDVGGRFVDIGDVDGELACRDQRAIGGGDGEVVAGLGFEI